MSIDTAVAFKAIKDKINAAGWGQRKHSLLFYGQRIKKKLAKTCHWEFHKSHKGLHGKGIKFLQIYKLVDLIIMSW